MAVLELFDCRFFSLAVFPAPRFSGVTVLFFLVPERP
jgi:hypothetical protein